jgi:hypothetical protein
MRCTSSQSRGHRSVESNSHQTFEFSARKSCVKKRMRIPDEPSGGSHQRVVCWRYRKTVEISGERQSVTSQSACGSRTERVAPRRWNSARPLARPKACLPRTRVGNLPISSMGTVLARARVPLSTVGSRRASSGRAMTERRARARATPLARQTAAYQARRHLLRRQARHP